MPRSSLSIAPSFDDFHFLLDQEFDMIDSIRPYIIEPERHVPVYPEMDEEDESELV